MTIDQSSALVHAIKTILKNAIAKGGTTLKDFMKPDGKPGYFKQQLFVYGRANLPCLRCGKTITAHVTNQRSTFHCPQCQL